MENAQMESAQREVDAMCDGPAISFGEWIQQDYLHAYGVTGRAIETMPLEYGDLGRKLAEMEDELANWDARSAAFDRMAGELMAMAIESMRVEYRDETEQ